MKKKLCVCSFDKLNKSHFVFIIIIINEVNFKREILLIILSKWHGIKWNSIKAMVRHTLLLIIKSALKCYCVNLHAFTPNESSLPSNDAIIQLILNFRQRTLRNTCSIRNERKTTDSNGGLWIRFHFYCIITNSNVYSLIN